MFVFFFFSSRRRHTRSLRDWSSDVCSSDLQRGGRWSSADSDPRAVASIRQLVKTDVYQLDGARLPFPGESFDQVVVVDYLEHIEDDRGFARELARVLVPGGRVIVNVPHFQPRSPLNRLRHRIGLTD